MPNSPAEAEPLDSFDDDLIWITDKLVARTGGGYGLVVRLLTDQPQHAILASSSGAPEQAVQHMQSSTLAESIGAQGFSPAITPPGTIQQGCRKRGSEPESLMWMPFKPTPGLSVFVIVARSGEEPYGEQHILAARTLYPVLERYIKLWWLHRTERHRAHALTAALDLSEVGMMLLSRNGRLVHANRRASTLLDRADGLLRSGQSIVGEHFDDGIRFQAAIQQTIRGRSGGNRALSRFMGLRRARSRQPLIVTVTGISQVAVNDDDPAVIIHVLDPEQDIQPLLTPVCRIYELTQAETRLAQHLVSGLTLFEAAQQMQIKPDTARTYLRQVFAKTGTNRQANLIRLLLLSRLNIVGEVPQLST